MPPYHTVSGNSITVYLDVVADVDGALGNPIDNVLAQLAVEWVPIAAANGLTLTFAFGADTSATMNPVPPALNVAMNAVPPSNVDVFTLIVGQGSKADRPTRSGRISYVNYSSGKGYIYERPVDMPLTPVLAVSHEMGHILGLTDRYYDAVYWLWDWAIDRTCKEIRQHRYVVPPNDFRNGVQDNVPAFHQSPRLAVRATLPMSNIMVPAETLYNPLDNLMSSAAASLTATQVSVILSQGEEQRYRTTNWVAVLGDWQRSASPPNTIPNGAITAAPDFPRSNPNDLSTWPFPAWEARPQDEGTGLLFLPPGRGPTPFRYGCMSSLRMGRHNGIIHKTRLSIVKGRTRVDAFGGTVGNTNGVNVNNPHWMCHIRRLIHDLM